MPLLSTQARRQQALAEIDSLTQELQDWFEDWTSRDRHEDGSNRGQYTTQLAAIHGEVGATAVMLREGMNTMSVAGDAGRVYGEFARAEREILWLRRVFYYFRDKFEQREDKRFGEVLRAADEVVWSCHRPFFQLPGQKLRVPAALPYIKPDFSPAALRRDQRQAVGSQDSDFVLVREAFRELPVPILSLPVTAIHNPWALVLIGHETGHIVERLIEPDFHLTFQAAICAAIPEDEEKDREAWSGWADEIFADLYSLLTMGPWAVWAMSQFEAAAPEEMAARRYTYPSPYARLKLLAAMADRFGLKTETPELPAAQPDELARDLSYVPAIAAAICSMPQIDALAKALPFESSRFEKTRGDVGKWSSLLRGKNAAPPMQELRSARMCAAGAAQAWSETVFVNDSPEERAELRRLALENMTAAGPLGVRSATAVQRAVAKPGASLFNALRRADSLVEEADAGSH